MNYFKTFILMFGLLALMMFLGQLLGGSQGMLSFFVIGLLMNFISYWFSDKIVLMMSRAKEVKESELPQVYRIVRKICLDFALPMPKIYLMESPLPNAFATGRDPQHAAVAVTTSLLNLLDERELTGVLGHEMSHVKNRDILISTVAAAIAGAIMMMSRMSFFFGMGGREEDRNRSGNLIGLVFLIFAPIAAILIQMAISRSREFAADESGARLTHMPLALADALKKLQTGTLQSALQADVSPATAHLYIVSPLTGRSFLTLFSTHPPILERVKRLEKIAAEIGSK